MEIPNADIVTVQSFEVVQATEGARLVVQGVGRPQVLLLLLNKEQTFQMTGKMFGAAGHIDQGQVVAVIGELARRVGVAPSVPAGVPAPAASASPSPSPNGTTDPTVNVTLMTEFMAGLAADVQKRMEEAGLSEAVAAQVLRSVLELPSTRQLASMFVAEKLAASDRAPETSPAGGESGAGG